MKILFVTDLYPVKDDEKTTPRTLYNFVKGFEKQGIEVDVIKPNFILNSFLRHKPFYKTDVYSKVLNINYWLPFVGNITHKLKKYFPLPANYSVIVSHMPSGSIFAHKLAKSLNLPFVCGIHISDLEILNNPLYSLYFKNHLLKAFKDAKFLACRSFAVKDKLCRLYPEFSDKSYVMSSGVPQNTIIEQPKLTNKNKIKVLTCANFKKRKNVDKVIKACNQLENFELTVIGAGYEKSKLDKLDSSVKFLGHLEHSKVLEKMRESDIFILPSINETFGMVYLEAMSQNCITICTKDDGISGIIKNGENGFLVEPNVESIKQTLFTIKHLDENAVKLLCSNTYNTINLYTDVKMCEKYLQQIFKIL